jgi:hypothetical protein
VAFSGDTLSNKTTNSVHITVLARHRLLVVGIPVHALMALSQLSSPYMIVKDWRLLVRIISAVANLLFLALLLALISSHSENLCKSFQAPTANQAHMNGWWLKMMSTRDENERIVRAASFHLIWWPLLACGYHMCREARFAIITRDNSNQLCDTWHIFGPLLQALFSGTVSPHANWPAVLATWLLVCQYHMLVRCCHCRLVHTGIWEGCSPFRARARWIMFLTWLLKDEAD